MPPRRAPSPCATPGCPVLVPNGGHCDTHRRTKRRNQALQRRASGDPAMSVYSTDQWRTHRRTYLDRHPTCVDCGKPATQADHVPPRQLLVALGIHNPDHERWLQPRCDADHARKTRTVDEPLLQRWHAGEDAAVLAEEAMGKRT